MAPEIVKLDRVYYGSLLVSGFVGKASSGEKVFECFCACGETVTRSQSQLSIRKLGRCATCRQEYVAERLETKAADRRKSATRRAHADDQPARA